MRMYVCVYVACLLILSALYIYNMKSECISLEIKDFNWNILYYYYYLNNVFKYIYIYMYVFELETSSVEVEKTKDL